MHLAVHYTTSYSYERPAHRLVQMLRVAPLSFAGQTVLDWRIDVDSDARLREHRDGYGNIVHMLYVDHPIDRLKVDVSGRILTEDRAGVVTGLPGDLPPPIFLRNTELTRASGSLAALAQATETGGDIRSTLHRLTEHIFGRMRFDTEATAVGTTASDAYEAAHGVCQDYTHIFIAAARTIGIPARYVSGHLFRRDGANVQPATHAWAEAYDPELGWIAFDPTNGICADDAYVRVACGLDYRDAAPFSGTVAGGGAQEMKVTVDVREARHVQMQHQQQQHQHQQQQQR
jgi:transglutaminase-like putative cysteine protease